MSRSVPEWIGKTPDEKVPPRVRDRIWLREGGMCHLAKRKILAGELWDLDHIVALVNGGEHRESNLAPALRDKHREKTRADVAEKARIYSTRAKHTGALQKAPSRIKPASFPKTAKKNPATAPLNKPAAWRGNFV